MSWESRDYYPGAEGLGRRPTATYALMAASIGAFLVFLLAGSVFLRFAGFGRTLIEWLALSPDAVVRQFRVWQIVTYTFVNLDFWTVVFAMLTLWFFGRMVEEHVGLKRYLVLFFGGSFVCALVYIAMAFLLYPGLQAAGPFGALMAILTFSALTWPDMKVICLFFPIKLKWLVLLLIGADVAYSLQTLGPWHLAHLAGAAWGLAFFKFHHRVADALRDMDERFERRRERAAEVEERSFNAEVDRILAKIAQDGMTSLSSREKKLLEEASRRKRVH